MSTVIRNFSKINLALMGGAFVTLILFYLMQLLIQNNLEVSAPESRGPMVPVVIPQKELVIVRETPIPDPIEEVEPPPEVPSQTLIDDGTSLWTQVNYHPPEIESKNFQSETLVQTEALALVRVQPVYPSRALAANIEGFVVVEFDISPAGMVINPRVLVSEPEGTFDNAALRAMARWKYTPKIVDGREVTMYSIQQKLVFDIE